MISHGYVYSMSPVLIHAQCQCQVYIPIPSKKQKEENRVSPYSVHQTYYNLITILYCIYINIELGLTYLR